MVDAYLIFRTWNRLSQRGRLAGENDTGQRSNHAEGLYKLGRAAGS